MLESFQREILRALAGNRSSDSYVAGGSALNRNTPRLSRDLDVFHKSVSLIDSAVERDLGTLRGDGYAVERLRETSTMREWAVSGTNGRSTKLQWTRDTSWLYFPPVPDPEFGFVLAFEDLAVNKMAAAADRGRMRDFHDLAALDLMGVRPWALALAAMGKDAELSPPAVLERCRRLLKQAGEDDEDPEYEGPSVAWPNVRFFMSRRLDEDLKVLDGFRWTDWAGCLPLDRATGRMPLDLTPETLRGCDKLRASPTGSWPTSPSISTEMLRRATHPALDGVTLDMRALLAARAEQPDADPKFTDAKPGP